MQTLVKPLLEPDLAQGRGSPAHVTDARKEIPKETPNRRVKAFIMGAISYDVPT